MWERESSGRYGEANAVNTFRKDNRPSENVLYREWWYWITKPEQKQERATLTWRFAMLRNNTEVQKGWHANTKYAMLTPSIHSLLTTLLPCKSVVWRLSTPSLSLSLNGRRLNIALVWMLHIESEWLNVCVCFWLRCKARKGKGTNTFAFRQCFEKGWEKSERRHASVLEVWCIAALFVNGIQCWFEWAKG